MDPRKLRSQKGQAIVLIAIMLVVVVGMAALAIDGARAYALRGDMQAAVDAAALAGADTLQQTGSYASAEQAATTSFSNNSNLYTVPTCTPGYAAPGAAPVTITCTYSDSSILTQVVTTLGPAGTRFQLSATRRMTLNFARILTNGTTPTVTVTASSSVNNLLYSPTVSALSQAGCGGVAGTAISVGSTGAPSLTVLGDVVSNGAITVSGGAKLLVNGDIYARCQAAIAGMVTIGCYPSGAGAPCTYPDVVGTVKSGYRLADPDYAPPSVAGGAQARPATTVVLSPGSYAVNPAFTAGCYFLSGGVYAFSAGLTVSGGFVSNELKPPDEPDDDFDESSPHQFWDSNGVNCSGSYNLNAVSSGGHDIATGTWALEVTSIRTDTYGGVSFTRESAPSLCHTLTITSGSSRAIQVQVSNVPGATSYRLYVAPPPNGCNGPFGLAQTLAVSGTVSNASTSTCPAFSGVSCSLGNESITLTQTVLGPPFAPNGAASPGVVGAYPPHNETGGLTSSLPNQNPARAVPPEGDRANENQCDTIAGTLATCPDSVTPGAVELDVPSGGCVSLANAGETYVFSGYQYNWISVYEPGVANPPANACSNSLDGHANSAFIGLFYAPSAAITLVGDDSFAAPGIGGVMGNTIAFTGNPPSISFDPDYAPVPPAAKLTS